MEKVKKAVPVISLEKFTGQSTPTTEKIHALEGLALKCLINLSEKLNPPPVAMEIMAAGEPMTLFTKGNFSIITGAAKSRKTFLISMLMAASSKGNFQDLFFSNTSGKNIIFDTEQAKYKVQQIARRICNLSENIADSNLLVYSLRTLEPSQRIDLIEYVLSTTQNINFVAIDGIIDLEIDPILQSDQAQKIAMKLMQWTEIYNIHITCVLHYNKTVATLLGHLGSVSHRKADAIIEVSKNADDPNISIVRPIDCREKDFLPFAFSVDPEGMPYVLNDYVFEQKKIVGKAAKTKQEVFCFHQLGVEIRDQILKSVFKIHSEQRYEECWRNLQNSIEVITGNTIGENKAKKFLTAYTAIGEIIKKEQPKRRVVYVLPGQRTIEFE